MRNQQNALALLVMITISGCGERSDPEADRIYEARHIQAPLLSVVLKAYAELIEQELVIESNLTDAVTMTINTHQKMTREEAIRFYEDTFLMNGFAILPADGGAVKFLSVQTNPMLATGPPPVYHDDEEIPDGDDKVHYIMNFDHISADDALEIFERTTGARPDNLVPAQDGATLILTAPANVIRTLVEIKNEIDAP